MSSLTQISDYKLLFEQKQAEFDLLQSEFIDFKETSKMFEDELEQENQNLSKKNEALSSEVEKIKEEYKAYKIKTEKTTLQMEKQIEKLRREKNNAEDEMKAFESKIIFLENENEQYNVQGRTAESFIKDLEEKIDKTLEQLALVQTELEENRQQTQEQVERLKQQLKETEEELVVLQTNKKSNEKTTPKIIIPGKHMMKPNNQNKENEILEDKNAKNPPETKGFSHSENLKRNIVNKINEMRNCETFDINMAKKLDLEEKMKNYTSNIKSLKLNSIGFSKSLILVNGLIKDLDEKIHKIRNFKPKRII